MIFFITLFRYFTIVLFFTLHFFSFSQGMQTRERAHCARSVFPFMKKKKNPGKRTWVVHSIMGKELGSFIQLRKKNLCCLFSQGERTWVTCSIRVKKKLVSIVQSREKNLGCSLDHGKRT